MSKATHCHTGEHHHTTHKHTTMRCATAFFCSLPPLAKGASLVLTHRTSDAKESFKASDSPTLGASNSPVFITSTGIPLAFTVEYGPLASLAVGTQLVHNATPVLAVAARFLMPCATPHAAPCFLLNALCDHSGGTCQVTPQRKGISLAWITLSDKGAAGLREDESGPLIHSTLAPHLALGHVQGFLIPDDPHRLQALVADLALHQGYDLIVSTGGTGLGPRDTTPEALLPLLRHRLPGFEQAMMAASLAKTAHASISRAIAGTMGQSIIITLPGSKKAVRENLEAVAPALAHALAKLQGDPDDCAKLHNA